jgi:AcrR family transcriptional regulator
MTAPAAAPAQHPPRVRHLLDAARAAFIAHGFAGVSIDALARDAGVSKETIYRHFADKEALFRAALEDLGSDFASRTASLHAAAPPLGEELAGLARAVLDAAVDGGLLNPLRLAAGVAGTMPDFAEELQAQQWGRMEPVRAALEDHARAQGIAAPVPLDLALDFGSLAVEGPALPLGFPPPGPARRAVIAARVAALFGEGVLHAAALRGPREEESVPPSAAPVPAAAPHIRALLDVAARHFLDHGYAGASLLEIGAEAKVGRGTLYRHFASKAGLFAAMLRDLAAQVAAAARVPALPAPDTADAEAQVAALAAFAAAAIEALGSDRSLALHRAAIAAAALDPALSREVHDTVRAPWLDPLAAWLAATAGVAAPRWLAQALLVLALKGTRLFATGRGMTPGEGPRHARRIARLFLHGYAAALAAEAPNRAQTT